MIPPLHTRGRVHEVHTCLALQGKTRQAERHSWTRSHDTRSIAPKSVRLTPCKESRNSSSESRGEAAPQRKYDAPFLPGMRAGNRRFTGGDKAPQRNGKLGKRRRFHLNVLSPFSSSFLPFPPSSRFNCLKTASFSAVNRVCSHELSRRNPRRQRENASKKGYLIAFIRGSNACSKKKLVAHSFPRFLPLCPFHRQ